VSKVKVKENIDDLQN